MKRLRKVTFGKNPLYTFVPFTIIVALILALYAGLLRPERGLPSPHIGKVLPVFEAETLQGLPIKYSDLITGEVSVINFFASWCVPCLAEHPLLAELTEQHDVPIYGIAWSDSKQNITAWLEQHGQIYHTVIMDEHQLIGLELGVYGVPETFIIDAGGVIRYRWAGPLTEELIADEILPTIEAYR